MLRQKRSGAAPPTPLQLLLRWRSPSTAAHALLLLLLLIAQPAAGSEGDASVGYRACVAVCRQTGCLPRELRRWNPEAGGGGGDGEDSGGGESGEDAGAAAGAATEPCRVACPANAARYTPPAALRLARWDCAADCAYHCMRALEARRAAVEGGPVWKYHGKWPFARMLGAQEIASVVFSLLNLAAHAAGLRRFAAAVRAAGARRRGGSGAKASLGGGGAGAGASSATTTAAAYPYAPFMLAYGAATLNAWAWSAVFHARDTYATERLDYFSADLLVAAGVVVAVVRTARLHAPRRALPVVAAVAFVLVRHVCYMAFVKFDYGYNVAVCIAAGALTAALWVAWAAATRHPARARLFQFVGAVHAAMALEVLDFPPLLGLFDAHALWHLATAPLARLWYDFLVADVAAVAGGGGSDGGGGDADGDASAGGGGIEGGAAAGGGRRRAGKREL